MNGSGNGLIEGTNGLPWGRLPGTVVARWEAPPSNNEESAPMSPYVIPISTLRSHAFRFGPPRIKHASLSWWAALAALVLAAALPWM